MNKDTKWIIKVLIIAIVIWLTVAFVGWLTGPPYAKAQRLDPVTKTFDITLIHATGMVYDTEGTELIGAYRETSLPMQRVHPGRIRIIEVFTVGGEHLLFALITGPPSHLADDEGLYVAAIERPGSLWAPLNGGGRLWDLGSANYRIAVKLYLLGTEGL